MREEVQTPKVVSTGTPQSPPQERPNQAAEQFPELDQKRESIVQLQDEPVRPEMLVSDEEVDQNAISSNRNCRHATHESGRWLREKKRRLVGRGRDGEWEPWLRSPEIDIPLSTANDRVRRFEEREGLRPVVDKVPDSGTFGRAEDAATLAPEPAAETVTNGTVDNAALSGGILRRLSLGGGYLRRFLFKGSQQPALPSTMHLELPADVFVPAGELSEAGIKKLEEEKKKAANLPKAQTRVQLPECSQQDRKRFEIALAELEGADPEKDKFQLALSAVEFRSRLIQGGLLTSLETLRNLEPGFEKSDDCQLVLECVSRIGAQIGACDAHQDHKSAA